MPIQSSFAWKNFPVNLLVVNGISFRRILGSRYYLHRAVYTNIANVWLTLAYLVPASAKLSEAVFGSLAAGESGGRPWNEDQRISNMLPEACAKYIWLQQSLLQPLCRRTLSFQPDLSEHWCQVDIRLAFRHLQIAFCSSSFTYYSNRWPI